MMNRLVVTVLALVLLAACRTSSGDDEPDYTPIPDAELFAQIGRLPGVSDVDISYSKDFGNTGYIGQIAVAAGTDPVATLDHAYAILRQGRYRASITVVAVQNGKQFSTIELGTGSSNAELTKRYGPQPGTGEPPQ